MDPSEAPPQPGGPESASAGAQVTLEGEEYVPSEQPPPLEQPLEEFQPEMPPGSEEPMYTTSTAGVVEEYPEMLPEDYIVPSRMNMQPMPGEYEGEATPVAKSFFGNSTEAVEKLEQTLAVIKPEAMPNVDEIFTVIRREGLAILKVRRVQLTAEQASQFFQDMYELPGFSEAVAHMYSGPILAMVLSGPSAVDHWLRLIGPPNYKERSENPKWLRARFGVPQSDIKNGLHGSASEADALRELHFFFPELVVEPIIADNLAAYYLNENVHPVLTIGLSKLVRERPEDPVMWLADWLLANNPNKPKEFGRNSCQ